MQSYTRFGGIRPFAVSLIIGGIDKNGEPKLFSLDPSGIFYRYKAVVIGEGEDKIIPILEERYKEMDLNEAIKFGIDVLKEYLGNNFAYERLILSYVKRGEKVRTLENHKVKELYEE
jgi:proteasome alpha subunit